MNYGFFLGLFQEEPEEKEEEEAAMGQRLHHHYHHHGHHRADTHTAATAARRRQRLRNPNKRIVARHAVTHLLNNFQETSTLLYDAS